MIPIAKPYVGEEEAQAAADVIRCGWITQGPKVKQFEDAFATLVGASFACAVSNCTTALHSALLALGVKSGDAVITVSHSFIATANAISHCGASPVFIDIDGNTFNMSAEALRLFLENKCERRETGLFYQGQFIAAMIIVHQIGMPADLKNLIPLAKKCHIPVIEDAACAIGSKISFDKGASFEFIGKPHGDLACFSFHPRKVLSTGEGGMITANDEVLDKKLRLLRHQGMSVSDVQRHASKTVIFEEYPLIGYNYRMTDIQAAMGLEQLKKIDLIISKRRALAAYYQEQLKEIDWIQLPMESLACQSNWQSFAIRILPNAPLTRNELMQNFLDQGVSTKPGIMNAHQEQPYWNLDFNLPISEDVRDSIMMIPLFTQMTDVEINTVIECFKNVK